jgi:hypothetical protein
MTIPVLIPARNEAAHIATTLGSLPEEAEPFVIPNGCVDDTAVIAEDFGVTVLNGSPEGKLPALQFAIKHLGERAIEPFVSLDAETRPVLPNKWLTTMLARRSKLDPERPAIVTGPHFFEGLNPISLALKNALHCYDLLSLHRNPEWAMGGTNMLFDLQDETTVQRVLELPHIWPLEDKALRDVVVRQGGMVANTIHPNARVVTDARDRSTSLYDKLRYNQPSQVSSYLEDAAPGSIPYRDFQAGAQVQLAPDL